VAWRGLERKAGSRWVDRMATVNLKRGHMAGLKLE
jgi:hypothetical protein